MRREMAEDEERCGVCGRPASALPAYGGPGNPLNGDFTGRKIVRNYRYMMPKSELAKWPLAGIVVDGKFDESKFVAEYGAEALREFYWADQATGTLYTSLECRECILLGDDEQYAKQMETAIKGRIEEALAADPPEVTTFSRSERSRSRQTDT